MNNQIKEFEKFDHFIYSMVPFTESDELSRNCKYLFEVPAASTKKKALSLLYGTQEHD